MRVGHRVPRAGPRRPAKIRRADADAVVVLGEEAVPDGVLVERGAGRAEPAPVTTRGAHWRGSAARGLGVIARRYVGRAICRVAAPSFAPVTGEDDGGGADRLHPDQRPAAELPRDRLPHRRPQPDQRAGPARGVGGGEQPRRSTNSAGSCSPRGGPPGSRSSRCTLISTDSRPAARASSTRMPPGRSSRRALGEHARRGPRRARGSRRPRRRRRSRRPAAPCRTEPRTGRTPCSRASGSPAAPDVDADVPVAQAADVRRHQTAAAGQVDEHRAGVRRGRDVLGARARPASAARELAVGPPPVVGEFVVLRRVVAPPPSRAHAAGTAARTSAWSPRHDRGDRRPPHPSSALLAPAGPGFPARPAGHRRGSRRIEEDPR